MILMDTLINFCVCVYVLHSTYTIIGSRKNIYSPLGIVT